MVTSIAFDCMKFSRNKAVKEKMVDALINFLLSVEMRIPYNMDNMVLRFLQLIAGAKTEGELVRARGVVAAALSCQTSNPSLLLYNHFCIA